MSTSIESRVTQLEKASKTLQRQRVLVLDDGTTAAEAVAEWKRDHPGEPPPVYAVLPRGAKI